MLEKNRTINEFAGSTRARQIHEARQEAKRANEQAIAAAHQRASGPSVTASSETQQQPQKPRINIPG